MYLLTLLAFFFHQIFELSDPAYQLCRKSYVNKIALWETFRTLIIYFIFESWDDALRKYNGEGRKPRCFKKINKYPFASSLCIENAG